MSAEYLSNKKSLRTITVRSDLVEGSLNDPAKPKNDNSKNLCPR